jgi:uncharacterized protein
VVPPPSGHTTGLVVALAKIPPEGREFAVEVEPDLLQLSHEDTITIDAPIRVHGLLRRVAEQVYFRGAVGGTMRALCSRCLEAVSVALEAELDAVFLPPSTGTEETVENGELDVYIHDGVQIDLQPLVRDQVVLAFPVQSLCREECAGLCQSCGVNRNEQQCTCQDEAGDSPFRVLRGLHFPESS